MKYSLIEHFLHTHFPGIEGAILFGSYVDNPITANDIDLLLVSKKFSYASKESFFYENIKINTIKINISDVFNILAKHFQQGDFYKLVFSNGIILVDKCKDLQFVRRYIVKSYPSQKKEILSFVLNETCYNLCEYKGFLSTVISELEFYAIISKIVSTLMDYFFFSNGIYHLKSEKIKSRYFDRKFPVESKKILKLIEISNQNKQKECLVELESFLHEYHIPLENKFSNDLTFDDYSQANLILYIEHLFTFQELKEILSNIKDENQNIQFYAYQVDEEHQEARGCYLIFDNTKLELEYQKERWLLYFQNIFSKYQYSFPYNNIFCYPEIKYIGKKNEKIVNQILTTFTKIIITTNLSKEILLVSLLRPYFLTTEINIEEVYNFYLEKLNSKTRSNNYLTQKKTTTEDTFFKANVKNENTLVEILRRTQTIDMNLNFKNIPAVPVWFHFQLIDKLLSVLLKNDFEKLFYIHCLKKSNE